jgi:electron transfer flavoprotein beta subunit
MKAKRKPLETIAIGDLNVEIAPSVNIIKTAPPATREAGVKVETVEELVGMLKERGVL